MHRLTAIVWTGIVSAGIAEGIFWWLDRDTQGNGIGWPFNSLWVWGGVGFIVGAGCKFVASRSRGDAALESRALAAERGRDHAESYSLPPGAGAMPMFTGWTNGRNAVTSDETALPWALFDFTKVTPDGEGGTVTVQETAALLRVNGLPAFDIRPRTLNRRVLSWAGFEGLTYDLTATDAADADTVRRFTELFQLAAVDVLTLLTNLAEYNSPEPPGGEEAVRRLITPGFMAVLLHHPACAIQSRPGFLVMWFESGVLSSQKRSELCDATEDIRSFLIRPQEETSEQAIPARAGTDADIQVRRLRNSIFGGVMGLFAGFVMAMMVMSALSSVIGFLVMAFAIASILLAVAVGAAIGSRMPVRFLAPTPSEAPARQNARRRATGCAVVVGFCGGAVAGFAIFVASKILFDWKLANFDVESTLFFGSFFGGALLGAVVCGIVVNRLYWWRQPS